MKRLVVFLVALFAVFTFIREIETPDRPSEARATALTQADLGP
jgi:hypothetical protein